MEDKAYSLQSPEYLAKEYGGNKQKLAQAAQMGLIDPTAAVMAGMFVDRMRSAALQEQAPPQQTVAQQVFTPPQPAAPPPPMPQGGMGAPPSPQGAPPQGGPPGMGAPPPPQGGPPGMAAGGLTTLPIPDQMFSEPAVDAESFAGGGIVSFQAGGDQRDSEYERWRRAGAPMEDTGYGRATAPRGLDLGIDLPDVDGLREAYGRTRTPATTARPAAKATEKTPGAGTPAAAYKSPLSRIVDWNEKRTAGREANYDRWAAADAARRGENPKKAAPAASTPAAPTAAPSGGNNKGQGRVYRPAAAEARPAPAGSGSTSSSVRATARGGGPSAGIASLPAAQAAAAPPPTKTLQDTLTDVEKMQGDVSQGAAFKEQQAALAALRSPEGQKARKKEDLWASLAEIGFGIASGQSSNALTNISAGLAAALPGINSRNKERRMEQREALKDAVNAELAVYGMKVNSVKTAAEIYKTAQELNLKGIEMRDALKMAADRNAVAREGNLLQYKASTAATAQSGANARMAHQDSRLALSQAQQAKVWDDAAKRVDASLTDGPGRKQFAKLTPQEQFNYRQKLIKAEYNSALTGGVSGATPASSVMLAADKIISGGR